MIKYFVLTIVLLEILNLRGAETQDVVNTAVPNTLSRANTIPSREPSQPNSNDRGIAGQSGQSNRNDRGQSSQPNSNARGVTGQWRPPSNGWHNEPNCNANGDCGAGLPLPGNKCLFKRLDDLKSRCPGRPFFERSSVEQRNRIRNTFISSDGGNCHNNNCYGNDS